tara:strand:- start:336 stop:476 length:141 start_codon:yes stop_codon:yes gene_type:complete
LVAVVVEVVQLINEETQETIQSFLQSHLPVVAVVVLVMMVQETLVV